jgi:2-methylcitrate dehydratase PrpD
MTDDPLTLQVARHYNSLQLSGIPPEVIDAAKIHALDSIGCLLAGTRLEPGRLAYELAAAAGEGSPGSSTLFGTADQVSYLDAVQAMSVAGHCGEMDDIHGGAGICIGGMIVPALLATAEKYGGSGGRFLEAIVAGYETVIRIGLAIDAPILFARGWWPSTVCGAFGVAAAGAKFLDWSAERTANALGIAALHSGGMITGGGEGATARHLTFGHAAQNGAKSLLAAAQGFSGPKRAFEDPRGFCLTLCSEPRWEHLRNFGTFHLKEVALKPYPCARQLHAGVEALLKIMQSHAPAPARIDSIDLALPTPNASMVNRPSITLSHAATVGSGQYVMAVTALRGKIDLTSFGIEFLTSVAVRDLMGKVKVTASAELDRHFPKHWPGQVTVKSGSEVYSKEVIIPKGESGNPMRPDEVREKFVSLAAPIIGSEKADLVVQVVESLETHDSLDGLLGFLSVPA